MTTIRASRLQTYLGYLRATERVLLKELAAFGVVGALSFAIDLGLFVWLAPHGALKAKAIAFAVSTVFAYVGNRYFSFSHRARITLGRETSYFFGINLITLVFSEALIALFVYGFGFDHAGLVVLVVNLVSIGIGTIFRFWAYKRFVFPHPDKRPAKQLDPTG